jgi:fructose-bisphosphate aldolase class I
MDLEKLIKTANALVAPGKGILAADESGGTIKRRFDSINVESTEDNRRNYRELLMNAKDASNYISGIILFDETIRQNGSDGTPLVKVLLNQGILPGIKVDKGTQPLSSALNELVTEGLDGLRDRLNEYAEIGAVFTKWRGVIAIGDDMPSNYCIETNAHALARFAALSQEAGLVPIIEPEVLIDGNHSINRCLEVSKATLEEVYAQLYRQKVALEGTLLKPSMILSGSTAENRADAEEVAKKTIECFSKSVPSAVPGIVFLSGGQSDQEATANLNAINKRAAEINSPWQLSFSFGRGLQASPLKTWGGKSNNVKAAQDAFIHRAKLTSAARQGIYSPDME